jgi:hypothetical protein
MLDRRRVIDGGEIPGITGDAQNGHEAEPVALVLQRSRRTRTSSSHRQ